MSLANRKTKTTFRNQFSPLARSIEDTTAPEPAGVWLCGQGSGTSLCLCQPAMPSHIPAPVWVGLGHYNRSSRRASSENWVQNSSKGFKEQIGSLLSWAAQHWPGSPPIVSARQSGALSTIVCHSHGKSAEPCGSCRARGTSSYLTDRDTGLTRNKLEAGSMPLSLALQYGTSGERRGLV